MFNLKACAGVVTGAVSYGGYSISDVAGRLCSGLERRITKLLTNRECSRISFAVIASGHISGRNRRSPNPSKVGSPRINSIVYSCRSPSGITSFRRDA